MATPITTVISAAFLLLLFSSSATSNKRGSVKPPFVASNFLFIDQSGDFLASINDTFTAAIMSNPKSASKNYYFTVYHTATRAVIWCANRDSPISDSGKLNLTAAGLAIVDESGHPLWSTPAVNSTVAALQLLESGNLVLVDQNDVSVWQSFDHPTDTIVSDQSLPAGKSLVGAVSESDWSEGDYEFTVTTSDAVLGWKGAVYWTLSMEGKAYIDSKSPVSQLGMNASGLYLFGESRSAVSIRYPLPAVSPSFRVLKIQSNGSLAVMRYTGGAANASVSTDFAAPADSCSIASACGKIGFCSNGLCSSCPAGFHTGINGGCSPSDASISLPAACSGNSSGTVSYLTLGNAVDYFVINFVHPVRNGVDLTVCRQLCSANCSCLAFFYRNQSGSCYLIENDLGSIMQSSNGGINGKSGYVKVIASPPSPAGNSGSNSNFPIAGLVLLPSSGVLLILIALICFERRRRSRKRRNISQRKKNGGESSGELEEDFSIPGLPVRFEYDELVDATDNFRTQVGSGGFGVVYKGTLKDKSVVAVKKITSMGAERKREFYTETAIIGNVHHVNLVKLKGFCAQGRERFLVYEYMNRGSLDRTLFGNGPPLDWQERFDIALGTARGLAYLHSGCDHKIIHCDVKPENILLHENFQVKISDFGLSKLLSPEQSGLFTTMRGTRGYLAPEWLTNSAISDKTDVYSYGMVLLEIVRGRKNCAMHISTPVSSGGEGTSPSSNTSETPPRYPLRPLYFPLLALEMHEEGRYMELVEPRIMGRVTSEEVEKLVRVALCCVHEEPSLRPSMANVVGMLEGVLPLGVPRLESLSFLRFYGRRFNEASTLGSGEGEQTEFPWHPGMMNSSTSASGNSFSYMSSQQVSGPR